MDFNYLNIHVIPLATMHVQVKFVEVTILECTYNIMIIFYFMQSFEYDEDVTFPTVNCSYISPDTCTGETPPTCCERIAEIEGSGMALRFSAVATLFLTIAAIFV